MFECDIVCYKLIYTKVCFNGEAYALINTALIAFPFHTIPSLLTGTKSGFVCTVLHLLPQ